jgi:hypothetical protein
MRQWRHAAQDTVYVEVGRAELQAAKVPREGTMMVVYQDHGGKLWVRDAREFEDGRFVEMEPWHRPAPPDARMLNLPPGSKLTIGSNGCTVTLPGYVTVAEEPSG